MVQKEVHRPHVPPLSGKAGKTEDTDPSCPVQPAPVVVKGCGRKAIFPCSGNGTGSAWSRRGERGYFWSASFSSMRNARNLNFNSTGVNPQNSNNRFYGYAVRPVQHSTAIILSSEKRSMTLTRERLLLDLYQAYYDARRHKSRRSYVKRWESDLKRNMDELCDDLYCRRYKALPSKCFIVDYPKKREIFAAQFRDRIVHHLYFNYTHELFERTFIADSYSCIRGRGTHYGIHRIEDFCRRESRNWQRKCYALHLDIRGYFVHISRSRLLEIALKSLKSMAGHKVSKSRPARWQDRLDMDFVCYLTREVVMLDPKQDCIICGDASDWDGLDPAKSMLNLEDGLGLPIGNLTSQLLSNVYLNVFDQYMKRVLGCRYYGRYVDDAIVISHDRERLLSAVPQIRLFLKERLGMDLHDGKLEVSEVHRGVEFLGVFIRPYRTYVSNHALRRMATRIAAVRQAAHGKAVRSINSYLGLLRHTSSYRLRRRLFLHRELLRFGVYDADMSKMTDNMQYHY